MPVPERPLTDEEVSAVFRRAAELDRTPATEPSALDRTAIERVAVEAGLSLDAVRRALVELDAGRLAAKPRSRRWEWPDATVTIERTVPVAAGVARDRIGVFLSRQTMRVARDRGGVTVWEPAEGVAANVARGVNVRGRIRLQKVNRVTVSVDSDVEADACTVRIELDFSKTRREQFGGAIAGTAVGGLAATGGVAGALLATELALIAVPIGAGMAAGVWFGSRSDYATRVDKAVAAVELALDELEQGRA